MLNAREDSARSPRANSESSAPKPSWLRRYWLELGIVVLGLVAMNLIFIAEAFRATDSVSPAGAGQFGDFVGGYVGTFFALISVVLLARNLRNQGIATQMLNFEAKYFELLRLHRENVAELEAQTVSGRKLFVVLIREYRSALRIIKAVATKHNQVLSQLQLTHIAYYCLFFGTGPNSSRMLLNSLTQFDPAFLDDLEQTLNHEDTKSTAKANKKMAYIPFEGHQSRLGHYYRHLYQAVRYVDQQPLYIDKYEYVKSIRAQLSNHEQAMLLINSLTPFGGNWWQKGFMLKYKMVQNLPRGFFDSDEELDVAALFPAGYFEWEETELSTLG